MPEGHTIRHCATEHARLFTGQHLRVSSPQGRFADAALVDGALFVGTDAWGKHLFHEYEGERFVHVHLGIYGTFTAHELPPPPPRDTTRMRLVGDEVAVDLVGPNTCELVDEEGRDRIFARLGPDPLRTDADPERAWKALQRRRIPVAQALLDQSIIAGVGNVYRAEVLWVFGIHPDRPGTSLGEDELLAMWDWLREQLKLGVRRNRIVTVDPKALGKPINRIRRGEGVHVYHQGRCPRCGGPFATLEVANRRIEACPTCQT